MVLIELISLCEWAKKRWGLASESFESSINSSNSNWHVCIAPPTRRLRIHHRANQSVSWCPYFAPITPQEWFYTGLPVFIFMLLRCQILCTELLIWHFVADATLTFETELMSIHKKSATPDIVFRILRFLIVPIGIICAVYYVYNRNRKTPSKREAARRKKR